MQQQIAEYWSRAKAFEQARDIQSAKAVYESILQLDAGHAAAMMRLSTIAAASDKYRVSHLHVLRAASAVKERRNWKMLPYVTLRLLIFDERHVLRDLIENADWSHREVLAQSAVLSQHLWLIGEYDVALRFIDHACRHVQASHLLHYSRANALRFRGQMEEATAEYEKCLALAPDYPFAHWSLAYHEKADVRSSRIDRVVKARANAQEGSLEWAHLSYALFKEFDDAGDVGQAWDALQAGAAAMKRFASHDHGRESTRFQELQNLTDTGFFKDMNPAVDGHHTPVFIVGMPRTGTTLLERILGNHDSVATAGELNDFNNAMSWESDHFFHGVAQESSVDRFLDADFNAIGRNYLRRTDMLAGECRYLLDKNPANFFNAGFIRKALPQAKIVCMLRNPMDACFSNMKELFSGNAYPYSYDLADLAKHYIGFEGLCRHWQDVIPEGIRFVRYEELVTDGDRIVRDLTDFCGIEYSADTLDITANRSPVSTASSSQVREPMHGRNVGGWQRYARQLEPMAEQLRSAGCI